MWLVIHRSGQPNLICGPFSNMGEASNFSLVIAGNPHDLGTDFDHDAVSFFNSREEAERDRNKEFTFVPVKE